MKNVSDRDVCLPWGRFNYTVPAGGEIDVQDHIAEQLFIRYPGIVPCDGTAIAEAAVGEVPPAPVEIMPGTEPVPYIPEPTEEPGMSPEEIDAANGDGETKIRRRRAKGGE